MKNYFMLKTQKWLWGIFLLLFLLILAATLHNDLTVRKGQTLPSYPKEDISVILNKIEQNEVLQDDEIATLFRQTGLGESAIAAMAAQGNAARLLQYQEALFTVQDYQTLSANIITGEESLTARKSDLLPFPDLQDGDILITAAAHTMSWRHGHCGLVVNAEKGEILEAFTLGEPSKVCDLEKWLRYPNVIQLRSKEKSLGASAVKYGLETLDGIPYSLLSDFYADTDAPKVTHCAHLVRAAYLPFGIELKKGFIVTPKDISQSDDFEVIEVRGMDPTTLWQ